MTSQLLADGIGREAILAGAQWGLPPVTEAVPLAAWLLLGVAIVSSCVPALGYIVWLTFQRRIDPLFYLIGLGAIFVFSFYVEPWLDVIGATTYMTNVFDPVVTIVDRPIPWHVVLTYAGGIPLSTMIAYRMITNGRPARELLGFAALISVAECIGEMISVHFGVMLYYDNNALVFGVPLPSLIQNGGMFVVIGWALAVLVPHLRGWRWIAVPFVAPAVYLAYTILCTLPSYYAIHTGASTSVSWALAVVSAALNLGAVLLAAYAPAVQRFRNKPPQTDGSGTAAPAVSQTVGALR